MFDDVMLKADVARLGLESVRFKGYQPSALLAQSLSASDVHLVSLRPELEGLIVPSKFYGICAAGRPSIFVGDKDGEIARLISRHGCGRTLEWGVAQFSRRLREQCTLRCPARWRIRILA